MKVDKSTFYKSYKALPLAIYIRNRNYQSKSADLNLCAKARIVAESVQIKRLTLFYSIIIRNIAAQKHFYKSCVKLNYYE
jgi:hypothetical protein